MGESAKKVFTVRLTEEQLQKLEKMAGKEGRSLGGMVRRLIDAVSDPELQEVVLQEVEIR